MASLLCCVLGSSWHSCSSSYRHRKNCNGFALFLKIVCPFFEWIHKRSDCFKNACLAGLFSRSLALHSEDRWVLNDHLAGDASVKHGPLVIWFEIATGSDGKIKLPKQKASEIGILVPYDPSSVDTYPSKTVFFFALFYGKIAGGYCSSDLEKTSSMYGRKICSFSSRFAM